MVSKSAHPVQKGDGGWDEVRCDFSVRTSARDIAKFRKFGLFNPGKTSQH